MDQRVTSVPKAPALTPSILSDTPFVNHLSPQASFKTEEYDLCLLFHTTKLEEVSFMSETLRHTSKGVCLDLR